MKKSKNKAIFKMTDKELSQSRRSNSTGSGYLYKIVREQYRRGLLQESYRSYGYLPEKKKRVSDYDDTTISPRLNMSDDFDDFKGPKS